MKSRAYWRVSVTASAAAEEAVAEWLGSVFRQPAVSYTDVERDRTLVEVYLARKPDWRRQRRRELAVGLKALAGGGPDRGGRGVILSRMRAEDWAESWKRHFRPIEIAGSLLVKPSWSKQRPRKGQAVVVLDPGLSFGTGQHPTTAFCLRQLVRSRRAGQGQSFLDMGTGSGILAIAAAKVGYAPVRAFDSDADALRVAAANARRNRVAGDIVFRRQDLVKLPRWGAGRHSVVCANLISNLLLYERRRIMAHLAPGGVLVLAGILESEFAQVRRAYETAGLRMVASRAEKEWRSGAFAWRTAAFTSVPLTASRPPTASASAASQ